MKSFLFNSLILAILASSVIVRASRFVTTPTLGNYPSTSTSLSTDTTVTPDAAPANTTSINVSTSTNFKGKIDGNPVTGVVRVTDAHPAGEHTVTVTAFDSDGASATRTFMLTVTTPPTCNPVTFEPAANFAVRTTPFAVAVGDFNGDGNQDLAVANFYFVNVSILLGNGAGDFSPATDFATGSGPDSVAVGDFNGDGNQDLAAANFFSGSVSILLGDGTGDFSDRTDIAVGSHTRSVAVGDFNGDGKQDLAVANEAFGGSNNIVILLGDGAGNFSEAAELVAGISPESLAIGDFNGDGNQDIVAINILSENVSIFLGNGTGNFSAATNYTGDDSPFSVAVGDFNGDGNQDLAVINASNDVSILLGTGKGTFNPATNFSTGPLPSTVAVGDFNGDGKQDLAISNRIPLPGTVSILLGDGVGNFGVPIPFDTSGNPISVAVGDFNGDGKQDLAVTNETTNDVSILLRGCLDLRSDKQTILNDLIALRSTATRKPDKDKLDAAIDHVTKSLASNLWIDQNHPKPNGGDKVFNEEKESVKKLVDLIRDNNSLVDKTRLRADVNGIVNVDRRMAQLAIDEAIARHGDPKDIRQAQKEFDKGESDRMAGKSDTAIDHYREAWKKAIKA